MILFFDTETSGLWRRDLPEDHQDQPHLVSLAAQLCDDEKSNTSNIFSIFSSTFYYS
jgi:hypothetical protein